MPLIELMSLMESCFTWFSLALIYIHSLTIAFTNGTPLNFGRCSSIMCWLSSCSSFLSWPTISESELWFSLFMIHAMFSFASTDSTVISSIPTSLSNILVIFSLYLPGSSSDSLLSLYASLVLDLNSSTLPMGKKFCFTYFITWIEEFCILQISSWLWCFPH